MEKREREKKNEREIGRHRERVREGEGRRETGRVNTKNTFCDLQ